jgi:hypothetical protein
VLEGLRVTEEERGEGDKAEGDGPGPAAASKDGWIVTNLDSPLIAPTSPLIQERLVVPPIPCQALEGPTVSSLGSSEPSL